MLNGKVKVMLTMDCEFATRVCHREMVLMWTYLGDIIRAVLSWDGCPDGSRVALGSGWDRERVCPCSVSSRTLIQGPG